MGAAVERGLCPHAGVTHAGRHAIARGAGVAQKANAPPFLCARWPRSPTGGLDDRGPETSGNVSVPSRPGAIAREGFGPAVAEPTKDATAGVSAPEHTEEHQPEADADNADEKHQGQLPHDAVPSGGRYCTVSCTARAKRACPVIR